MEGDSVRASPVDIARIHVETITETSAENAINVEQAFMAMAYGCIHQRQVQLTCHCQLPTGKHPIDIVKFYWV